jgi:hypothetical protein
MDSRSKNRNAFADSLERDKETHRLVQREAASKNWINGMKVFWLGIPRSQNIQLLLHEQLGLISHRFFHIADIHDPEDECDFFETASNVGGIPTASISTSGPRRSVTVSKLSCNGFRRLWMV